MKSLMKSATESFADKSVGRFIYEVGNGADAQAEAAEKAAQQAEALAQLESNLATEIAGVGINNIPAESPIYEWNNQLMLVANGLRRDQPILSLPTTRGPGHSRDLDDAAVLDTYGMSLEDLKTRLNALATSSAERSGIVEGEEVNAGPLSPVDDGGLTSGSLEVADDGAVNSGPLLPNVTFNPDGTISRPNTVDPAAPLQAPAGSVDAWLEAQINGNKIEGLEGYNDAIAVYNGTANQSTIERVQQALVDAGVDLGNTGPNNNGVDGINGSKTRNGVSNTLIPQIQQALTSAGLDTGGVGNGWGPKSIAALEAAQENDTSELEAIANTPAGRELLTELLAMDEGAVVATLNALTYFGIENPGNNDVTPGLVESVLNFADYDEIRSLNLEGADLVKSLLSLHQQYEDLANSHTKTNMLLDHARQQYSAELSSTMAWPSLEAVYTNEAGERVTEQINNFAGDTQSYKHTHHQSYFHANVHSEYLDNQLQDRYVNSASYLGTTVDSRSWSRITAQGQSRNEVSGRLDSGQISVRPTREAIARITEPVLENGVVTLKPADWYQKLSLSDWDKSTVDGFNYKVGPGSTVSGVLSRVESSMPERYNAMEAESIQYLQEQGATDRGFVFTELDTSQGSRGEAERYIKGNVDAEGNWDIVAIDPETLVSTSLVDGGTWEAVMGLPIMSQVVNRAMSRYLIINGDHPPGTQDLIRCKLDEIKLLENPAPAIPEDYAFLRNGFSCGELGTICTTSHGGTLFVTGTEDRQITPEPEERGGDGGGDDGGGDDGVDKDDSDIDSVAEAPSPSNEAAPSASEAAGGQVADAGNTGNQAAAEAAQADSGRGDRGSRG